MNDIFEYAEKMYPELEKVLYNQEQFNGLLYYDTPPAMQKVFDKIKKEIKEKEQTHERNREFLRDLLESLDYIYVHGDKYVAIEDVLKLV